MATPVYEIRCTQNNRIARGVYEMRFEKPSGCTFKPGQFFLFDVPLIANAMDVQARALSIGSTPAETGLLFVVKMKEGGRLSKYISEVLRTGMTMTIKGPFGFFLLDRTTTKDMLFIATGAGVAPFRSQIKAALEDGDRRRIDLVFGVSSEEDLFWIEEFEALTRQYDNFFLHLTLTEPSPAWTGHCGRVQVLAPKIAPDIAQRSVYVCGNPDMTADVKKLCLETWGIPKEDLHVEGYI